MNEKMTTNNKKSIKKDSDSSENTMFINILESNPVVKILALKPDGDFVFSVQISDLGLDSEALEKEPIAQTVFFANFTGELLVRRNLIDFVTMLDQLDQKTYDQMINHFQHKHFGLRRLPEDETVRFVFHSSLIQDILTEDLVNMFCA
ncbi:MAG: hypothetical protein M0R32_06860 [Candidatus Cloacimonetes bacterium]|jgi:hypothetical protein|nr:hypothetical protein [Candidatus Cloacimonadota bacterium]